MTNILDRRVEKILPDKQSLEKLLAKKKIRVYQGFDPTANRLHLGHTVGLRKLMDFANSGHEVIFLFGTGTVLVGDPSERDTGRKLITQDEINENIKNWQAQVAPLVDFDKVTIKQNGDWLLRLTLTDIIGIASNISAIQLFKRDSFKRRLDRGDTVWYHETLYPLLQGYDSVVMDVDLEIGGTDQEFNMLIGRELQKKLNGREKFVLTTPMIHGTDGGNMSKTTGNCIWLDDTPDDMYGKILSLPDNLINEYWHLVTNLESTTPEALLQNPLKSKKTLAYDVTKQFHGVVEAKKAQGNFETVVQKGSLPLNLPTLSLNQSRLTILDLCKKAVSGETSSQIKRTIAQGGVTLNDQKITDINQILELKSEDILKFGKRKFYKISINP
jgi:tyrosyl-tRNA synthetase